LLRIAIDSVAIRARPLWAWGIFCLEDLRQGGQLSRIAASFMHETGPQPLFGGRKQLLN
jgi:hypothetical protein